MTHEIEPSNVDDLVRRYESGSSANQIGRELGVNFKRVLRILRDAGVKIRGPADAKRCEHPTTEAARANSPEIIRRYLKGQRPNALARAFGSTRMAVLGVLKANNISLRGRSEAEALKWASGKHDRAFVERQCSAAWKSSRGRRKSLSTKLAIARTQHRRQTRVGYHEQQIRRHVHGFAVEAQFPVGPYNVDLAIPEYGIAVEVQSSGHRRPTSSIRPERLEYILDRNWCVLVVYVPLHTKSIDAAGIGQQIVALAERVRRSPSLRGQYGMIGRNAKPVTPRRLDLPDRPRIPGL